MYLITETYLAARTSLIAEERSRRHDTSRLQGASKDELEAEEIIRAIKLEEAKSIWFVEHEGVTNTFPGMEFLSGRSLVVKSKLFQILTKMPKGGLLHAHLDATVNVSFLLKLALAQPAVHVRAPTALSLSSITTVLPEFRALPASDFTNEASLTANDYAPGAWVSLKRARETFDPALALTINPGEAYGTHNTVLKIWEKFTSIFKVASGLTRFKPIMIDYIREFFRSSIEDGISYVEARLPFWSHFMIGADGQQNVTHREWVMMFEQVVNELKADLAVQGRTDEFYGARIIYTTLRQITCEELEWYLEDCIQLKQEFPHLIAGFDLVGNENTLNPLIYYIQPLLRFKKRVAELGLDLPFIFHAGETLGDGSEADDNLYDAILLGTKRIGHGFSLAKHPRLIELVKEKNIAIEISIFGNMGLSFDFFQVLVSSDITGLITLGDLARQSLEHSTLESKEKATVLAAWERRWKQFIKSIVDGSIIPS
ncbi:adenosine deaminase-related growth [Phellopilus nigrolimitatus]|nr:adenosine deaminase-related growth [Phellopilus nigrolimitatus]